MFVKYFALFAPKISLATLLVLGLFLHFVEGRLAPAAANQPEPAKQADNGNGKERRFDSAQPFMVFQRTGDQQPKFLGTTPTADKKGIVVPDDDSWFVVPAGPEFAPAAKSSPNGNDNPGTNPKIKIRPIGLIGIGGMPLGAIGNPLGAVGMPLGATGLPLGLTGLPLGAIGMPLGGGLGLPGGLQGFPDAMKDLQLPANLRGAQGLPNLPGGGGNPGNPGSGANFSGAPGGVSGVPGGFGGKPGGEQPKKPNVRDTRLAPAPQPPVFVSAEAGPDVQVAQIVFPKMQIVFPKIQIPPIKIDPPALIPPNIENPGNKAPAAKKATLTDDVILDLAAELRLKNVPGISIDNAKFKDAHLAILASYRGLKSLTLRGTGVSDDGLAHLSKLPELRELVLDGNFTGKGLVHLKDMSLRDLTLSGPKISNSGIQSLGDVKDLKTLRLRWTRVTDEGIRSLARMKNLQGLETIDLLGREFSDLTLAELPVFPALTQVRLYLTSVTDAGLPHLAKIAKLSQLTIDCCGDGQVIPVTSTKNDNLTVLAIPASSFAVSHHIIGYVNSKPKIALNTTMGHFIVPAGKITDDGLRHLAELRLKSLSLSNWNLTDACLAPLEALGTLTSLKMDTPGITNKGLPFTRGLANLEMLDLRCTSITGAGAFNLRQMTQMKTFYAPLGSSDQDLTTFREALPMTAQVSRGNPYEELNQILGKK